MSLSISHGTHTNIRRWPNIQWNQIKAAFETELQKEYNL
jgi:hypothetical protein